MAAGIEKTEGERKDDSLDKIYACIDNNKSFLLDAGAGSGKTWSLIKTLEYIIENKDTEYASLAKKIGCITYTNVAVDEIKDRIGENSLLIVNTIHDFFWDIIVKYQQELKDVIIDLYEVDIESLKNRKIQYKEFKIINDGIISHNEVIKLSWEMFFRYPKLRRIFMDRFPIVLVDEYQDTDENIVNIFLECLSELEDKKQRKDFMVGFFGDFMQSIYDKGIGSIDESDVFEHIPKETNYRSSEQVINLLNTIREDINQYPAGKNKDIEGSLSFLYL
ncbi:MAG: UvrD-helicase domain-containing protein [Halothermotrichaceae bacterium]